MDTSEFDNDGEEKPTGKEIVDREFLLFQFWSVLVFVRKRGLNLINVWACCRGGTNEGGISE